MQRGRTITITVRTGTSGTATATSTIPSMYGCLVALVLSNWKPHITEPWMRWGMLPGKKYWGYSKKFDSMKFWCRRINIGLDDNDDNDHDNDLRQQSARISPSGYERVRTVTDPNERGFQPSPQVLQKLIITSLTGGRVRRRGGGRRRRNLSNIPIGTSLLSGIWNR